MLLPHKAQRPEPISQTEEEEERKKRTEINVSISSEHEGGRTLYCTVYEGEEGRYGP